MASVGERKRLHKAAARQRQGRPRKEGVIRYGCGKVKVEPVTPNERVMRDREFLAGSTDRKAMAAAENPLDLCGFNGWITVEQHAAGLWFADLHRKARLGLPGLRTQDLAREIRGGGHSAGEVAAIEALILLAQGLRYWPRAAKALVAVCLVGQWPRWIESRYRGVMNPVDEPARLHLLKGLNIAMTAKAEVGRRTGAVERERAA